MHTKIIIEMYVCNFNILENVILLTSNGQLSQTVK